MADKKFKIYRKEPDGTPFLVVEILAKTTDWMPVKKEFNQTIEPPFDSRYDTTSPLITRQYKYKTINISGKVKSTDKVKMETYDGQIQYFSDLDGEYRVFFSKIERHSTEYEDFYTQYSIEMVVV